MTCHSHSLISTAKAASVAALTAIALFVTPASALETASKKTVAEGWKDIGASERIEAAGRLHMLSQRIAASTCHIGAGAVADISRGILAGSADEVDRIIDAIEFGNARMKIVGAEYRPETLKYLHAYRAEWEQTRAAIDAIYIGAGKPKDYARIEASNLALLRTATYLVSEISGQYSNPAELVQADAILIDISGRQRMRTQKMLKEACAIWGGDTSTAAKAALADTINFYDVSLTALIEGMPNAGVKAAPTSDIEEKLDALSVAWTTVRPTLDRVAAGETLSEVDKVDLYLKLNDGLIETDRTMTLYTKYSKPKGF